MSSENKDSDIHIDKTKCYKIFDNQDIEGL